jgi:glucokinase
MPVRLVADLGGTHIRFALADSSGKLEAVRSMECLRYAGMIEATEDYLDSCNVKAPGDACFAVAAVDTGDHIAMTNNCWRFSRQELIARFGFHRLQFINDFAAIALSLPHLNKTQVHAISTDLQADPGNALTIGPGTGLGGARLLAGHLVIACEPGQAGLSPGTSLEREIFAALQPGCSEIVSESVLSGPGLERLHQTLARVRGEPETSLPAAAISAAALEGRDALCQETLGIFCALLGSAAGNFAVSSGAYGGVYLAGGIVPQIIPILERSDFLARFVTKGAMESRLRRVAVMVILEQNPGLVGAAAWPFEN